MKKAFFILATVLIGLSNLYLSFLSFFVPCHSLEDYVEVIAFINLLVVLPVVVLEILKLICYKGEERKVYSFDILGIILSGVTFLTALVIFIFVYHLQLEEVGFVFPPTIVFVIQTLIFSYKPKTSKSL